RLGQPAVVGEIAAGLLLGPTVAHGAVASALFPTATRPLLAGFADLGVALLMFAVGLEFEPGVARGPNRGILSTAVGSLALPLAAGAVLGLLWRPGGSATSQAGYVLFMAVAMSVTAFPVLVRILEDRELIRTPLGRFTVTSAAACDVVGWLLLALAIFLAAGGHALARLAGLPVFVLVLFTVVRPLFRRLAARGHSGEADLVLVVGGVLGSCAATEWMGLHFIFGAFLFGMAVAGSGGPSWAAGLHRDIEPVGVRLLMPVYFVVAGWQVNLPGLSARDWLVAAAVTATAVAAKFTGSFAGARLGGLDARQSCAVGVLMNTRGLTELVVLTTGRQLGLLDGRHYTILVVMALVTTAVTGPALTRVAGRTTTAAVWHRIRPAREPNSAVDLAPQPGTTA
ncbi:MAG: cation/H(+) antiporter, partial [Catenulispora sp.]|nr:cation/H(+) antiporter [Catenulispora sp.]